MNIISQLTETSKLYPDVSFTVRRLSMLARTQIDMQTLALRQRQREIQLDYPAFTDAERDLRDQLNLAFRKLRALSADEAQPAIDEIDEINKALRAAAPEGATKARGLLDLEFEMINQQLKPPFLNAALVSITGLTADGVPVDAGHFAELAPADLADEVYDSIESLMRLSADQAKNSPSPSTSGAVAEAPTPLTTVPNAAAPPIPITQPATA